MKRKIPGFEGYYTDTDSIYMGLRLDERYFPLHTGEMGYEKTMRSNKISDEEFNSYELDFELPMDPRFRKIPAKKYLIRAGE